MEARKVELLSMVSCLGEDVMGEDGRFHVEANPQLLGFMKLLHKTASQLLKEQINHSNKESVVSVLNTLAVNASFQDEWLRPVSLLDFPRATKIVFLKKLCDIFMKSKQRRVLDQMGLLPSKQSKSLV